MARKRAAIFASGRRSRGSITLVSLCLTTALGIALGSYLALCMRSAQFSARLLSAEKAQQLAQVGMEEALWSLNNGNWTNSGPDGNLTWATSGVNRTVTLPYSLAGSDTTGQIALTVANYASTGPTWPTVTSTATVTLPSGQTFSKSLQATTSPVPLFGNAIASAESYVSFVAGGFVDSWNSDPDNNSATAAVAYPEPVAPTGDAANYAAVIAGRGDGTNGVMLTQATVRGYVSTFGLPVSYSTSGSPAASVVGPATAAGVSVDSSRLGKSAFVPLASVFSVNTPAVAGGGGGLLGSLLTIVADLLGAPSGAIRKWNGNLNVNGGLPLFGNCPSLTINQPVRFIVDGDLTISGSGKITINAGGSLELFVSGDVTIGGDGFKNLTNEPKKLAIYCTHTSDTDSLQYTSSENFCGVIFCEHKPIDIRQNAKFYGALLSRNYVRFSTSATSPQFHYDTALREARFSGITTPYVVKKVTEL